MAGYGSSAGGHSFGHEDDVLQQSVDDDMDEMVQRNIQDVLRQASAHDRDHGATIVDDYRQSGDDYDDVVALASVGPSSSAAGGRTSGTGGGIPKPAPGRGSTAATGAAAPAGGRGAGAGAAKVTGTAPATGSKAPSAAGSAGAPVVRPSRAPAAGPSRPPGGATTAPAPLPGRRTSTDTGASVRQSGDSMVGVGGVGGAGGPASMAGGGSASNFLDVPGQPEASLRLHKARLKAVEDELARANRALTERDKQLSEALRELKDLRTQAAGWARDKKALETQVEKANRRASEAETAARSTEGQVRELSKQDSRAERDRKAAEAEVRARDVRLQRALEEVERYKQLLNDVRAQERDVRGAAHQDSSKLLADNRRLERQRAELIAAFKKQLKLIEVLKRQKVHLEAARALQFTEKEFMEVLEMGTA